MGRASRAKTERRAAHFEVFCPGVLEVLSIGKGDLRLMVGTSPEDRDKAKALIEEMLRKGYTIFVETDKGPVKVKKFNPNRMTYIIEGFPEVGEPVAEPEPDTPKMRRNTGPRHREVPVAGSRSTAVGRTAGG